MKKLKIKLKQLQNAHTMSESERTQLRASLSEYMELNPIHSPTPVVSSTFSIHNLWQHKIASAALMLVLFFGSGAGAAYASADALPGDTLYKVKILTEDTQNMLTISDSAKARLAERFAERRERELQKLEEMGRLNDEKLEIIKQRLKKHKKHATKVARKLKKTNPKQVEKILENINKKEQHIKYKHLKKTWHDFELELLEIQEDYGDQEKLLNEIEKEAQDLH